jgi:hypothetical protein
MTRFSATWLSLLAALSGTLLSAGCSTSTCNHPEDFVDVDTGYVNQDRTTYVSSLPGQDYVYMPPNRTLRFRVGLGSFPTSVNVALAFSPGFDATLAPAAGNSALIKARSADTIELKNDTCTDYYVWLTATASATAFMPVDAGAGGSDGSGGEAGAAL